MVQFNTIDGRRVAVDEKFVIGVIENKACDQGAEGKCTILLSTGNSIGVNDSYDSVCVSVGENGLVKAEYAKTYSIDDDCMPTIPIGDIYKSKHAWSHLVNGLAKTKEDYAAMKLKVDRKEVNQAMIDRLVGKMSNLKPFTEIDNLGDLIRHVRAHGVSSMRKLDGVGDRAIKMMYEVFSEYGYNKRGYKI